MSFDLPMLPESWRYQPLDQLSKPGSITYGVVQPGAPLNEGVPIIRVNNFKDGRIELADLMRIDPAIEGKYGRTRLKGGEVLLTIVGSVGQVAVAPKTVSGFNVARAVAVIHPADHVESEWIALCLRSPLSQHLLGSRANTTVQTTINLKDLRALPIPLPPVSERREIASVMSALDDRITLLRETNATLEAIAQALFKSWFVDFDPVQAKAEGRQPEGMDAATAALFPDSFEESELGLVPKGWGVTPLSDSLEVQIGGVWGEEAETGKATVRVSCMRGIDAVDIGAGRVPEVPKRWVSQKQIESRILTEGDILVEGSGSFCGRSLYWIASYAELLPLTPIYSNFVKRLASKAGCEVGYWAAIHLSQIYESDEMSNYRIGSAFPNLDVAGLLSKRVSMPQPPITVCFYDLVRPLLEAKKQNTLRMGTLAALRDTLLPRLISGQLRLPEAEQVVDEAIA